MAESGDYFGRVDLDRQFKTVHDFASRPMGTSRFKVVMFCGHPPGSEQSEAPRLDSDFYGAFLKMRTGSGHHQVSASFGKSYAQGIKNFGFSAPPVFQFVPGRKTVVFTDLKCPTRYNQLDLPLPVNRAQRHDVHRSAVPRLL